MGKVAMLCAMLVVLVLLVCLGSLNPQLFRSSLRAPAALACSVIQQRSAVPALLFGDTVALDVEDPIAKLWDPDRFSHARAINGERTLWSRTNYGLVHLATYNEAVHLELSPNGSHTTWEEFGYLTHETVQVVAIPGGPSIADFLGNQKSCWGTLSVHLSGENPDEAAISLATFLPAGPPELAVIVPDE
jgi:hypothetical protein